MQLFEQKKSDGRWTRARFLRQIFSKNGLFSKILAFLESAQWAGWKNGLTFLIWWTLLFDLFLARARQLKSVYYHSLTHLRLFSMLSDVKLGHFEVITPQQYNGYPWCSDGSNYVRSSMLDRLKPKIGCSSSITNRWTCSSSFDVRKWCSGSFNVH